MIPGQRVFDADSFSVAQDHPAAEGWSSRHGVPLLRSVATAMVELSQVENPGTFALPYPDSVQSALDRMVLTCLLLKAKPPGSVPKLVHWCTIRPVDNWVFPIPSDIAPRGSLLVDPSTFQPTQLCYEWAGGNDGTGLRPSDRKPLDDAAAICREEDRPDVYRAFRELMIKRPVLTGREFATLPSKGTGLELLQQQIQSVYLPAPLHHMDPVSRTFTACGRCRTLLHRTRRGDLVCELDTCRGKGPVKRGREYGVEDSGGVLLLTRSLRQWVAGPGRIELRLAGVLERVGAMIQLWPSYGAYGMSVALPDGQTWAVEVKDWVSGALLGRSASLPPQDPPYDRCVWAVPRRRLRAHPSYENEFMRFRSGGSTEPGLVSVENLSRTVRQIVLETTASARSSSRAAFEDDMEGLF
ncbi:hypothetical protein [Streptomyces sp. NPDC096068]|uniref:pPIWI_RE_Y domain-containing protein n=1 Tax=Streptomyces sp. NPDC096068 TaxID=3155424 RepID=UPI00331EEA9E